MIFSNSRLQFCLRFTPVVVLAAACLSGIPAQAGPIPSAFGGSVNSPRINSVFNYGNQTSYSESYRSGQYGVTGSGYYSGYYGGYSGYSSAYPYGYPANYPPGAVIVNPGYNQYPASSINNSVLVNPTVVNSSIYNSTLINPKIFRTPNYAGSRYYEQTTIIRYRSPGSSSFSGTTPAYHYRYRHASPYFR